jgi:drug/metabolite transporter (DMT)-like permease
MSQSLSTRSPLLPGVPLALASAFLFGASTPFAKMLVETSNPQLLAGLLYLGAGVGLAIGKATRFILGVRNSEAPLRRADAPWMIAIVTFGGILGPLFLMLGLARTSAASGSLLLNLEGLATMAIAWVFLRENVDRKLLLGAAAILAGAVALSWQGQGIRVDEGGLLIAAACLAWGVDNNLTRRLSVADPVVIALTKGVVAGSANLTMALLLGARMPSIGATGAALVVGFCGVGLSLVLFVLALRHLGSARTLGPIFRSRRSLARSSRLPY